MRSRYTHVWLKVTARKCECEPVRLFFYTWPSAGLMTAIGASLPFAWKSLGRLQQTPVTLNRNKWKQKMDLK